MIVVGVDLGKRSHAVCFVGADGREVAPPLRVAHTGAGLRRLQARLAGWPGPQQVVMAASGPHWLLLERRLRAAGLPVQVVNPLQTAGLRRVGIRKTKTDAKDARVIAELARLGRARPSYVPDDAVLEVRELVRFRWHLVCGSVTSAPPPLQLHRDRDERSGWLRRRADGGDVALQPALRAA